MNIFRNKITNIVFIGTYKEFKKLILSSANKRRRLLLTDISITNQSCDELLKKLTCKGIKRNDVLIAFNNFNITNNIARQLFSEKIQKLDKFLVKKKLDIIVLYCKKNLSFFHLKPLEDCIYKWYVIRNVSLGNLFPFGQQCK